MVNTQSFDNAPMRLQKFLARAGVASRRACEEIILEGRVCVNGETVKELGVKVDPGKDVVHLDGSVVVLVEQEAFIMLHKPEGYVTTMTDPFNRPCVADLVPTDRYPGLFAVGRLDLDTTGLLLFTTNGEVGHELLHPRKHVEKTYHARVVGIVGKEALSCLQSGVELDDGMTAPARVEIIERDAKKNRSILSLSIHEGRKRQVRRMCSAVGHRVEQLHRVSFGPLDLGDLPKGAWRTLTPAEIDSLKNATK